MSHFLPAALRRLVFVVCVGWLPSLAVAAENAAPSPAPDFAARFEQIKRSASPARLYAFLYDLPKGGDLHHHLGGAGWGEDWFAIAADPARNGGNAFYTRTTLAHYKEDTGQEPILYRTIQKSAYDALPADQKADYQPMAALDEPTKQAWMSSVLLDKPNEGREEFFELTWPRLMGLLRDPHVVAELMVQNMKRFGAEGVRYIEAQVGVFGFVDHDGKPIDAEAAVAIYKERLNRPDALATGVVPRFQYTVLRFLPDAEDELDRTYAFIDKHRDLFVGINMAGREDRQKGYPARFLPEFRKMRRQYSAIQLSIHAGETDEPDHHVRDTLLLGATRIGHGVNLINDPETMLYLRDRQFLVEINLISNKLLEYVPDLSKHPFPEYLRFGIPVCLNTDDRGMWGSDMTDEYFTGVTNFNLTWPELVQLGRNSLAYSFAQPDVKKRLLEDYDKRVSAFEARYLGDDWVAALPKDVPRSYYAEHNFNLGKP